MNSDRLIAAKAILGEQKLSASNAARLRFEQREQRLERRKLEAQQKRQNALLDPMARALAKAKALSERSE